MSLLSRAGLRIKGDYLFYVINRNTAVLAGAKAENNKPDVLFIPEKLGRYTVRGIADKLKSEKQGGRRLSEKNRIKLARLTWDFFPISRFSSCNLPDTLEYIGDLPAELYKKVEECKNLVYDELRLPRNVVFTDCGASAKARRLILPKDIEYIGPSAKGEELLEVRFGNEEKDKDVPHATLEQYRGFKKKSKTKRAGRVIGKLAFKNCKSLLRIEIPENISDIEEEAFSGCQSLTTLPYHMGELRINDKAFERASYKNAFSFPSDIPKGISWEKFGLCPTGKIVLDSSEDLYKLLEYKREDGSYFIRDCNELDFSAFKGVFPERALSLAAMQSKCPFMKKITFGEGLTEIGNEAFAYSRLESIVLPKGLRIIRKNAFKNSRELISISLPESIEIAEESAFEAYYIPHIRATKETIKRLEEQPGYKEYLEKRAKMYEYVNNSLKKYEAYFKSGDLSSAPKEGEMDSYWIQSGQDPELLEKILTFYKNNISFSKENKDRLTKAARLFGMLDAANKFENIYAEKMALSESLSKKDSPSDWAMALKINPFNSSACENLLSFLIKEYDTKCHIKEFASLIICYIHEMESKMKDSDALRHILSAYKAKFGHDYFYLHGIHEKAVSCVSVGLCHIAENFKFFYEKLRKENAPAAYSLYHIASALNPEEKLSECPKIQDFGSSGSTERAKSISELRSKPTPAKPKATETANSSSPLFTNSHSGINSYDPFGYSDFVKVALSPKTEYRTETYESGSSDDILGEIAAEQRAKRMVDALSDENFGFNSGAYSDIDWSSVDLSDWGDV